MKTIVFTVAAAQQYDRLPGKARQQVGDEFNRNALDGRGDVKKLTGRDGFRLRIGRYRILFDEDQVTVLALYIGKRETGTYRKN